jgi:hypothetical protein
MFSHPACFYIREEVSKEMEEYVEESGRMSKAQEGFFCLMIPHFHPASPVGSSWLKFEHGKIRNEGSKEWLG